MTNPTEDTALADHAPSTSSSLGILPTAKAIALLVARLIFAGLFAMAAFFKFSGMAATASYIASAGFGFPLLLAWLAACFEAAIAIAFLTGAFFSEAAILAAIYVLFLALSFHGPSHWSANRDEFGLFIDHFTFIAGLLFAAVHGPGARWALHVGTHALDGAGSDRNK